MQQLSRLTHVLFLGHHNPSCTCNAAVQIAGTDDTNLHRNTHTYNWTRRL